MTRNDFEALQQWILTLPAETIHNDLPSSLDSVIAATALQEGWVCPGCFKIHKLGEVPCSCGWRAPPDIARRALPALLRLAWADAKAWVARVIRWGVTR